MSDGHKDITADQYVGVSGWNELPLFPQRWKSHGPPWESGHVAVSVLYPWGVGGLHLPGLRGPQSSFPSRGQLTPLRARVREPVFMGVPRLVHSRPKPKPSPWAASDGKARAPGVGLLEPLTASKYPLLKKITFISILFTNRKNKTKRTKTNCHPRYVGFNLRDGRRWHTGCVSLLSLLPKK